jgi:hypothetical protein
MSHTERFFQRLAFGLLALVLAAGAWAQDDPPGRVGRLARTQGGVSWFDHEQGAWAAAERNRPLTTGDRIATAVDGRAELRVGSTVLRLAGGSELELLRVDDERIGFQLHSGSLALRVRTREAAGEIDLVTGEARLLPQRAGHYRIDRLDDTTQAGVWRGTLRIEGAERDAIETGQRAEIWRAGPRGERGELRLSWSALPDDAFAAWALGEDERDERSASSRHVSPEMTGVEDLDRSGRWDQHPEYGAIWWPDETGANWAPYRDGHWIWMRPWGWTWIDDAPWGFAPFHYGRWVHWRGRWGWCPGERVPRPVYAPALVAWVSGAPGRASGGIVAALVGWVPLAPREVFVPYYRSTPSYAERINVRPPHPRHGPPTHVPGAPLAYGNQGMPGGVTMVVRDVLMHREPVGRALADGPGSRGEPPRGPLLPTPPPVREAHPPSRMVPGAGPGAADRPLLPPAREQRPLIPLRPAPTAPPRPAPVAPRAPQPEPGASPPARPPQAQPDQQRPREDERRGAPERHPNNRERENQR